jgi:hypothetical protein
MACPGVVTEAVTCEPLDFPAMTDETWAIRHTDNAHVLAAAFRLGQDIPGAERRQAAVPAASVLAADELAWPRQWRRAWHTVALCRRAAEIAARH